jgi:hypothetical protein
MKRFLVLSVFTLLFVAAGTGFAADRYGAAGCGLGSMLLGDESGFIQVFAATTNGTSGNQTFGISSGTSNCKGKPSFSSNERLNEFVKANLDNLAKDVAMGHGESLETLTELLKISPDQRQSVHAKLKDNFTKIFPSEMVQMADVVDNIISIING